MNALSASRRLVIASALVLGGVSCCFTRNAAACSCETPEPVVLPPTEFPAGKTFRAPVNTHVWILEQVSECGEAWTHSVVGPRGPLTTSRRDWGDDTDALPALTPRQRVLQLVPESLEADTTYEVWRSAGSARQRIGRFTTGRAADVQPPTWSGFGDWSFRPGRTQCGSGQPEATLATRASDDVVPQHWLLLSLRTVVEDDVAGGEHRASLVPLDTKGSVELFGGDHCVGRNFFFPEPLQPATIVGQVLDLSGNASSERTTRLVGPHTATSELTLERANVSPESSRGHPLLGAMLVGFAALAGFALGLVIRRQPRKNRAA